MGLHQVVQQQVSSLTNGDIERYCVLLVVGADSTATKHLHQFEAWPLQSEIQWQSSEQTKQVVSLVVAFTRRFLRRGDGN